MAFDFLRDHVFGALFNPGLTGAKRYEEQQLQKRELNATAMKKLQSIQQSQPQSQPHQLLNQLMMSPEGMDAFLGGAGDVEYFTKMVGNMTPPMQEAVTLSPGQKRLGAAPMGQEQPVIAEMPPEIPSDVRSLDIMMNRAGFDAAEKKQMARALVKKQVMGDPTELEAATARLVEKYGPGVQETIDKIKTGLVQTKTIKNEWGESEEVTTDALSGEQSRTTYGGNSVALDKPRDYFPVQVPQQFVGLFEASEAKHENLPRGLLARQAWAESGFDVLEKSPKGALGISQFMPETAKEFGVFDPTDPAQAIPGQAAMMSQLVTKYQGNVAHALAAYNWGQGNVDKWIAAGAKPSALPEETRDYLRKILGGEDTIQSLYSVELEPGDEFSVAATVNEMGPAGSLDALIQRMGSAFDIKGNISEELEEFRTRTNILRAKVAGYYETKGEAGKYEQELALATVPELGPFTSPGVGLGRLRALRRQIIAGQKTDESVIRGNFPSDMKKEAARRMVMGEEILQLIGSEAALNKASQEQGNRKLFQRWREVWEGATELEEQVTAPDERADVDLTVPAENPAILTGQMVKAGFPQPMADAAIGFFTKSAEMAGIPLAVASQVAHSIGLKSVNGKAAPDFSSIMREYKVGLRRKGIPADQVNTWAGTIGAGAAEAVPTAIAMIYAAPYMAVARGGGIVTKLISSLGKFIQNNKLLTVTQEMGAGAGAEVAGELTEGKGTGTQLAGTVAGAMAGGMSATGAFRTGQRVVKGVTNMASRITKSGPAALQADPIRPKASPDYTQQFAGQQIEGDLLKVQTEIEKAIQSIPAGTGPDAANAMLREKLQAARKTANAVVDSYWKRVDVKAKVPTTGLRSDVLALRKELLGKPGQMPTKYVATLLGRAYRAPKSVETLLDLRGQIRADRIAEQAKPGGGNQGLARSYVRLENIILDQMEAALPNNVALSQARAMSRSFHQMFDEGQLGAVLRTGKPGQPVPRAEDTGKKLFGMSGGDAALNRTLQPDAIRAGEEAVTAILREEIGDLPGSGLDTVGETVKAGGRAVGRINQWKTKVKELGKVHAELDSASASIGAEVQKYTKIKQSAVAKYSGLAPQKAIDMVMRAKDPAKTTKNLVDAFRGDKDAIEGFQQGLLDNLFARAGNDPVNKVPPNLQELRSIISAPNIAPVLEEAFKHSPDRLKRFKGAVETAYELSIGNDPSLIRTGTRMTPIGFLGRAGGSMIVRNVFGINTIQGAAAGATVGEQSLGRLSAAVNRVAGRLYTNLDPTQLFIQAIVDPRFERLLAMRAPTTTKEAQLFAKRLRRLQATIEGSKQTFFEKEGS